MQLSHYLKVFTDKDRPGHRIVFSTKNASKILVPEETFQAMETGTLSDADEALLAELGMLVPNRAAEKQAMGGFLDGLNQKSSVLNILVVLNLDCNFSCVYCYEGGMKGKIYMSDATADRLVRFIRETFSEDKKELLVDFYGGEPLLSLNLIQHISGELKSFTAGRGASYGFTLVTNGSLFKRQVAEDLVQLGLSAVKITLDGPAETHNHSRPFKSGAGSFDAIIRNLRETCDLVRIGIGGNFERHNYHQFPILLDHLLEIGLTPDKIAMVKFDPVMQYPEGDQTPPDYRGGCRSINEPWIIQAGVLLREEILKRGYRTLGIKPTSCMVEMNDSLVVNYDGTIYKCPAFIGRKGFEVGTLETGVTDASVPYHIGMWKNDQCAECEYLPLCFGGCRYMTLVRDGNIEALDCQKTYLDANLETLVKQDIRYQLKAEIR